MKYNPDKQGLNKKEKALIKKPVLVIQLLMLHLPQELKKIKTKYQMLADQVLILLGTNSTFSTKIEEVEKKNDDAKYITTAEFTKFSGKIFNAKLKTVNFGTNKNLTMCY